MVELIFATTRAWGVSTSGITLLYHTPWNAFFMIANSGGLNSYIWKVFLDGSRVAATKRSGNFNYLNSAGGNVVACDAHNIWECDPLTVYPYYHKSLGYNSGSLSFSNGFIDSDAGLFLTALGYVYDTTQSPWVLIRDRRSAIGFTPNFCSAYADGQVIWIDKDGSGATIYDYRSDAVVRKMGFPSNTVATYDMNHKVLVALVSDKLRIYSTTDIGYSLSAPTFVEPLRRNPYGGNQVYTRLTDAKGNPVPDKWVHWLVLGSRGIMEKDVVKSDANGYSYNYYYGPAGIDLGSETIQVSVNV